MSIDTDTKIVEVRKAYYPLLARVVLLSIIFDVALIFAILLSLYANWSSLYIVYLATTLILVKTILLIIYAIKTTMAWTLVFYYIDQDKLIMNEGFYNPKETIYSLNNLNSVETYSNYLGRLLKYGDITLRFLGAENQIQEISLWGVVEPFKYQKYFQKYLK